MEIKIVIKVKMIIYWKSSCYRSTRECECTIISTISISMLVAVKVCLGIAWISNFELLLYMQDTYNTSASTCALLPRYWAINLSACDKANAFASRRSCKWLSFVCKICNMWITTRSTCLYINSDYYLR